MYLERTYIKNKDLMPIQQLGLHLFKTEIVNYPPIKQQLKEILYEKNLGGKIDDSLFDFLLKQN